MLKKVDLLLAITKLLDFDAACIVRLIEDRGRRDMAEFDRIGAIYDFVQNGITFGCNRVDDTLGSEVFRTATGSAIPKARCSGLSCAASAYVAGCTAIRFTSGCSAVSLPN